MAYLFQLFRIPPPSPWGLNHDNIFSIPQLSAANLGYARASRVHFAYVSAPLVSNIPPSPSCKKADAEVIYRNREAS